MNETEYLTIVKDTAKLRKSLETAKSEREVAQQALEATELAKIARAKFESVKSLAASLEQSETAMREAALKFEAAPAGIHRFTNPTVYTYDERIAIAWVVAHKHHEALQIVKSAFEKIIKSLEHPPKFVTVKTERKAEIMGSLSEWE